MHEPNLLLSSLWGRRRARRYAMHALPFPLRLAPLLQAAPLCSLDVRCTSRISFSRPAPSPSLSLGTKTGTQVRNARTSLPPQARTSPPSCSSVLARRVHPISGDSRLWTTPLGRRSRTREPPSAHARRSLPLSSAPLTRAPTTWAAPRLISSRLVPPLSSSTGIEDAPHPSPSTGVPPLAIVTSSLSPSVAAMCDDTPNTRPVGKKKKRMLGRHRREQRREQKRNSEEPSHRGMSNRTSARSSKSGILCSLGGEEAIGR